MGTVQMVRDELKFWKMGKTYGFVKKIKYCEMAMTNMFKNHEYYK